MRLLSTASTPEASPVPLLEEFIGSQIPRYAILSHTWEAREVSLQDLQAVAVTGTDVNVTTGEPAHAYLTATQGFRKIQQTCALARERDGLCYAWVDTCCIDKSSSAELTEAINSMYAWYERAEVCYVYLSDLEPVGSGDDDNSGDNLVRDLPRCRWFTRGWTLQELIAPREVLFFDREWNYRGSKMRLAELLSDITGIPKSLLQGLEEAHEFAVARRMSWASRRETTRLEDLAYCLFGIFDVHMPLTYGEGMKAFERLQSAIVRETADLSILAWRYVDHRDASNYVALQSPAVREMAGMDNSVLTKEEDDSNQDLPMYAGVLADSPRHFAGCGDLQSVPGDSVYANFAVTTWGIQTEASLICNDEHWHNSHRAILDVYCNQNGKKLGICIRKIGGGRYVRYKPRTILEMDQNPDFRFRRLPVESLTLATKLPLRYPFYPGVDPVLGNRYSALVVNWGQFDVWSCRTKPTSHWDRHDEAFFSTNDATKGWSAFIVRGEVPGGDGGLPRMQGSFLLVCFHWNMADAIPTVWVADWDDVDPALAVLLESQLDHIRFESSAQARELTGSILGAKLEEHVGRADGTADCVMAHWLPQGKPLSKPVFSVSVHRDYRPDICTGPVWALDVTINIDDPPNA